MDDNWEFGGYPSYHPLIDWDFRVSSQEFARLEVQGAVTSKRKLLK
jgi:hypothetical protein